MTYDELMAAVGLLALEDPEQADNWRRHLSDADTRRMGATLVHPKGKLYAYLPEDIRKPVDASGLTQLVLVNWTPPKP